MNMGIIHYSGFKQVINTYISKRKRQKKKIWDAVHNRNVELFTVELTTSLEYVLEDKYREFVKLQQLGVLWELKYQERINNIIKKKFHDKIYIWRSILVRIHL
jgi:hypothetical protein